MRRLPVRRRARVDAERHGKLHGRVRTLADGLGGNPDPETITFELIQRFVDDIVTVSEEDLAGALRGLVDNEHLVTEGAGAAATAAVASTRVNAAGRRVAVIVSGSNIDRTRLMSVLAR